MRAVLEKARLFFRASLRRAGFHLQVSRRERLRGQAGVHVVLGTGRATDAERALLPLTPPPRLAVSSSSSPDGGGASRAAWQVTFPRVVHADDLRVSTPGDG